MDYCPKGVCTNEITYYRGGTHKDLDGLGWKNMGAGCMSLRPSTLLSAMSCDAVGLCGSCDKHGGSESRLKYEAVKQSPSKAIIINLLENPNAPLDASLWLGFRGEGQRFSQHATDQQAKVTQHFRTQFSATNSVTPRACHAVQALSQSETGRVFSTLTGTPKES